MKAFSYRSCGLRRLELGVGRGSGAGAAASRDPRPHTLLDLHASVDSPGAAATTACVVCGMLAGAESVSESVPVASDDAAKRLCLDRRASERAFCSLVRREGRD